MSEFKSALSEWMHKIGVDCDIKMDDEFAYNVTNNTLLIATEKNSEVECYLEQFFYEYGADYVGYGFFVLGILHELGHYFTLSSFDTEELLLCKIKKMLVNGETMYKTACEYWETPDEFAANIWAINFINHHTAAVDELANIFNKEFYHVY